MRIHILNRQGRRKAQFITNAVMHYLHCSNTPEIPQPALIDTVAIETIVRRIMEEQSKSSFSTTKETATEQPQGNKLKTESIRYAETAELLDKGGIAAIANTMAMFRK